MLEKTELLLGQGLDPSAISKRKQGAMMVSYVEGWFVLEQANRIFGYDGWQSKIQSLTHEKTEKGYVAVCRMSVTVDFIDGSVTREDVGVGDASTKQGLELAIKDAVTDSLKRAFRSFGNQFGNSLYDKRNDLHTGKEDTHASKHTEEDSAKVMQMLEHDLGPVKTAAEWKKVVSKYGDDVKKLPQVWKEKANALAMKVRGDIQKEGE